MGRAIVCLVALALPAFAYAEDLADTTVNDPAKIRAAITRAIPPLEAGSRGSAENRKCFTCHSQALPVMALHAAKGKGFPIDEANLQRQIKHTRDFLQTGEKNYLQGKGQGGQVLTAGYALWMLAAAEQPPDDVTRAVANYLLSYQNNEERWQHRGKRPPSSGSDFTASFTALRGLQAYAGEELQPQLTARKEVVAKWLQKTEAKDTEDRVFRLRMMQMLDFPPVAIEKERGAIAALQREDGGWSQTGELESDAYATGSVLAALLDAGVIVDDEVVRRAVKYLLDTQQEDGTWHVSTRAIGFQEYFESGFPHGEDQFISIAASSWAMWALVKTLPEKD